MTVKGKEEEVVLIMAKGKELKKYERKNKRKEVMKQDENIEESKVQNSSASTSRTIEAGKVDAKKVRTTAKETPPRKWPVRERKVVERFSFLNPKRELGSMLFINRGKGMKLKDIPNVAYKLTKKKADNNLQILHTILFGKKTNKYHMKRNISQFSGFIWTKNEEKEKAKLKAKIDKCVKECLLDFCEFLDIPVSKETKKVELSTKLLDFLESPHATTEVLLAMKKQSKRDKKHTRMINIVKATSCEELAKLEGSLEERTTDDGVFENENYTNESKEQEDFLLEEDNTQVIMALEENEQNTQGTKMSTKKHVHDSALKKNKAELVKENPTSEVVIEKGRTGKNKVHTKPQVEPSREEILNVVSGLLKKVNFDVVTFADITKELEVHFNINLSQRKAEMRRLIEEAIQNMVVIEELQEVKENDENDLEE